MTARRVLPFSRMLSSSASEDARGTLRVNPNVPFAQHCLLPILPVFLEAYPGITLDLVQTDMPVDLIYERADVAIRTGHLSGSALKAHKLLETPRRVVASKSYLYRFGEPKHPTDLERHDCLNININGSLDIWPFDGRNTGEPERLDQAVKGNLRISDGETMRQMALAGVGIARLSDFQIGRDVAEGRLVPILEAFNPRDTEPVQTLFVDHAHLANRIRVFIDYVVTALVVPAPR